MLTKRIKDYLNRGDSVAAEIPAAEPETRCFVVISAEAKTGVPREERRYLNSRFTMWEYWNYEFRRFKLRTGWEYDEWNYDDYLFSDERRMSVTESEFYQALSEWIPDAKSLRHVTESDCPL